MANKEYSLSLKLGAKLSNEFSGTFSKAQQLLKQTQREIAELNKIQTDISAYERQKQAVSGIERKLSDLQKEYDNIQREMDETSTYSSALENKLIEKQRAIDNTAAALDRESTKLDDMERELKEAGVDTDHLTEESQKLAKQQDELAKKNQEAAEQAKNFGNTGTNAFEAVGSALVAAGIANGLKQIFDAYKECVSIAGEFHETLSAVEAISGASADDMAQLTDKAKDLGATTKFTATEAAQAMTYMGMAGWDATQMISGMDGVIQLAAASGEDLAQVSDIVTDNLTAFGLKAEDTAHFADVLAAAASNSNTSVGIMGETFRNCAPLAGALGYSVEDVAVAIGLMANAGIKGSNAGTALKNIFNGLLGEVKLTSEAFGEVTYSAVKSDGTMKSFSETLDDLRVYFSQMTGAEKMANAEALVGQRAMAGFVQLMNSAGDDVDKLTNSITNCSGAAEKMAKVRLDNFNGQMTLLNSASDALKTTIGEAFMPMLTELAKAGTTILTNVNNFLSKHPVLLKATMATAATIGTIVAAYTTYTWVKKGLNAVRTISIALKAKETAATTSLTASEGAEAAAAGASATAHKGLNSVLSSGGVTLGLFVGGMVGIVELCKSMQAYWDDLTKDAIALNEATKEYKDTLNGLQESYDMSVGKAELTAQTAQGYIERLKELEDQGVKTAKQQSEYAGIIAQLHTLMPDLNLDIDEQTGLLREGADALEDQVKAWKEKIKLNAIEELATQRMQSTIELEYNRNQAQAAYNAAKAEWEAFQRSHPGVTRQTYNERFRSTDPNKSSVGISQQFAEWFGSDDQWSEAGRLIQQMDALQPALDSANAALEEAEAENEAIAQAYADAAASVNLFGEEEEKTTGSVEDGETSLESLKGALDDIITKYNEAYEAALTSIQGQYNLWDYAAEVVPKDIDAINAGLDTQTAYWDDYNTDLHNLLGRTGDVEGLAEVIASFADGSAESVNAIAGMAAASDEDLKIMVENWQQVRQMQQEAAEAVAQFDVEKELEGVQDDFRTAVEDMDMSSVARTAAENTMQAYIDALRNGTMDAVAAAAGISVLVSRALAHPNAAVFRNYVNGPQEITPYASGTDNAAAGWKLLGEHGPELMYSGGGEQVFTAAETARILNSDGGSKNISIAPVIQISGGNASADEIIDAVSVRLVPIILDAVNESAVDERRGAYV